MSATVALLMLNCFSNSHFAHFVQTEPGLVPPTCFSKDPPLVHAGGEEDRSLGDAHEQVRDRQVDDEHVGRRPQTATPATRKTRSGVNKHLYLGQQSHHDCLI